MPHIAKAGNMPSLYTPSCEQNPSLLSKKWVKSQHIILIVNKIIAIYPKILVKSQLLIPKLEKFQSLIPKVDKIPAYYLKSGLNSSILSEMQTKSKPLMQKVDKIPALNTKVGNNPYSYSKNGHNPTFRSQLLTQFYLLFQL